MTNTASGIGELSNPCVIVKRNPEPKKQRPSHQPLGRPVLLHSMVGSSAFDFTEIDVAGLIGLDNVH